MVLKRGMFFLFFVFSDQIFDVNIHDCSGMQAGLFHLNL